MSKNQKKLAAVEIITRHLFTALLLSTLLYLFHQKVDSAVKAISPTYTPNIFFDAVIILLSIFALMLCCFRLHKTKIISDFTYKFFFYTTTLYTLYRLNIIPHSTWKFTNFSFSNYVYHIDIYLIFFIGFMLLTLRHAAYLFTKKVTHQIRPGEPIQEECDDKFGYTSVARAVLNKILNTPNLYAQQAVTIGIIAKWGLGKSSFLNLIKSLISYDKAFNNKFVYVEFNPWATTGSMENITDSFLQCLKDNLSPYNPNLKSQFNQYIDLLVKSNPKSAPFLQSIFNKQSSHSQNLHTHYKEISREVGRIEKRIVVAIDDIDRLKANEIISVLELVRNATNFKNIIFLIAYDEEYVSKALTKLNVENPEGFLEKLINIPFILPKPLELEQRSICTQMFEGILAQNKKDLTHVEAFTHNFSRFMTIRQMSRFIYTVVLRTGNLVGENGFKLCLYDMLCIEFIKFNNKELYYSLKDQRPPTSSIKEFKEAHFKDVKDDEKLSFAFDELYNDFREELINSSRNKALATNSLRFKYPDLTSCYFNYKLSTQYLSQEDYDNAVKLGPAGFAQKIKMWLPHKKKCLERMLELHQFKTQAEGLEYLYSLKELYIKNPKDRNSYQCNVLMGSSILDFPRNHPHITKYYHLITEFFLTLKEESLVLYMKNKQRIEQSMQRNAIHVSNLDCIELLLLGQHIKSLTTQAKDFNSINPLHIEYLPRTNSYVNSLLQKLIDVNPTAYVDYLINTALESYKGNNLRSWTRQIFEGDEITTHGTYYDIQKKLFKLLQIPDSPNSVQQMRDRFIAILTQYHPSHNETTNLLKILNPKPLSTPKHANEKSIATIN